MKRIFLLSLMVLVVSTIFISCSGNKNVTATRNQIKGNWVVSSVTVEGEDAAKLNITSFDDVALNCFDGSEWSFPNNSYGNYNITKSGCRPGERRIIWSQRVKEGVTYLNFKHMDDLAKKQAKAVADGYSLEVTSFTQEHFTAKSAVSFEGKTIYIVYDFDKK
ncbi:MAG: hypothetical protein ACK5NK_09330 [Niabella sp.]